MHSGIEAGCDNQQLSNKMAACSVEHTSYTLVKEIYSYANILPSVGQQLAGTIFKFIHHYIKNVKQISL
jgi:hypothetical protein